MTRQEIVQAHLTLDSVMAKLKGDSFMLIITADVNSVDEMLDEILPYRAFMPHVARLVDELLVRTVSLVQTVEDAL